MDVGEKIFYPMHGAGLIKSIEDKDLGDYCERFYVIELPFEQNLHIYMTVFPIGSPNLMTRNLRIEFYSQTW